MKIKRKIANIAGGTHIMNTTQLPEDLFQEMDTSDPLIVHSYNASPGFFKGKSMLNWNAISLVMSGEKVMHFAEKSMLIKEDEFHILSAGNCIVSMNLNEHRQFSSLLFFFRSIALDDFRLKYDAKIKHLSAQYSVSAHAYLAFPKDEFIKGYMNSLQVLLQMRSGMSKEMKSLKFEELMLYLLSRYPEQIAGFLLNKPQKKSDLIIRKAVESAICNPINLEELSFICSMSVSTFKRNFIKLYGIPPNQWFIQKRIELAKHYLIHQRAKPGEIYYQIGYENHASFSKKFKELVGLTPREFQNMHFKTERNATAFE